MRHEHVDLASITITGNTAIDVMDIEVVESQNSPDNRAMLETKLVKVIGEDFTLRVPTY